MAQTFFNCASRYDLKYVPASINDRKTAARPFDSFYDTVRSLSLVQSNIKGRYAPTWRKQAPTHMRLSGTDGLRCFQGLLFYDNINLFQILKCHWMDGQSDNPWSGNLSRAMEVPPKKT